MARHEFLGSRTYKMLLILAKGDDENVKNWMEPREGWKRGDFIASAYIAQDLNQILEMLSGGALAH